MVEELKSISWWRGVRPWSAHSLVLAVSGLLYILIGVGTASIERGDSRWDALVVARYWMPLEYWAMAFAVIGVATIISARWPPTTDTVGYMVLSGFSAGWGAFWAMGVIFEGTNVSNLNGFLVYSLVSFLWWAISRLVDPHRLALDLQVAAGDRNGS